MNWYSLYKLSMPMAYEEPSKGKVIPRESTLELQKRVFDYYKNYPKTAQPKLPLEERGPAFEVGYNLSDADFYLISKGSSSRLGEVSKSSEGLNSPIGIKVLHTDRFAPRFLYYQFMNFYNQGLWERQSYGTLPIRNIRVEDVKSILNQIDNSTQHEYREIGE